MDAAFSAVLVQMSLASGASAFNLTCEHRTCWVHYNPEACRYLSVDQIREKYPSFSGICPSCRQPVRVWASLAHFQALEGT